MVTKYLSKPGYQYLFGLLVNIVFLSVLFLNPVSHNNLQIPEGLNLHNIWEQTDVLSYVDPARNFIGSGVFGYGNIPDYFRTIGYPFFISIFVYLSPHHWLILLLVTQCLLLALLYPVFTKLAQEIFDIKNPDWLAYIFIINLISGIFWARVPFVLPDLTFLLFFYSGLYYGVRYFKSNRWISLGLYIGFITCAALIRPTLSLFPLVNIVLGIFIFGWRSIRIEKRWIPVVISTVLLFFATNLSTYRNIINHHFYSPSSVIGLNAFEYLGKYVLQQSGEEPKYLLLKAQVDSVKDITQKVAFEKLLAKQICKEHPVAFIKVLTSNTINVLLDNHVLNNTFAYFGYTWKVNAQNSMYFKKSRFCFYGTYLLMAIYFVIWLLFAKYLVRLLSERRYEMLLLVLVLFFVFLAPAIVTGSGGSRFRLPIEFCLIPGAFSELMSLIKGRPVNQQA